MRSLHAVPLVLLSIAASAGAGYLVARFALAPPSPVETGTSAAEEPAAGPVLGRRAVVEPLTAAPLAAESANARWVELNGRAIEHLEAGELDEAIALFESCLEGLPDEPVFRRNLAEALVRKAVEEHEARRPCEACPELIERALELDPSRGDLVRLADRWRMEAEAERDFWRESSQHFDLAYDGGRDEILWGSHRILAELESAYTDLGLLFGRYPVEEGRPRISVVLYRREGFDALTGLGDWAGGAFDGTVRVPVGDFELEEERLRGILRHELVHAFVRAVGGTGVPGWLNEGLAQWLELDRGEALGVARSELAGVEPFPLSELEGSLASWKDERAISYAYAQSLLFCDHLARQYGERLVFQMVEGCAEGASPARTFREATRVELDVAAGDLAAELR